MLLCFGRRGASPGFHSFDSTVSFTLASRAASFPSTRGDVWGQLQRLGIVAPRDVEQVTAAREFLLNAISHREYDCAKEMAAQLLQRRRSSPLVLFIRVAPPPVIRGAHALWLRARLPRPR